MWLALLPLAWALPASDAPLVEELRELLESRQVDEALPRSTARLEALRAELGDDPRVWTFQVHHARLVAFSEPEEGARLAQEAIDALGTREPSARARAQTMLGRILAADGHADEALAAHQAALAMLDEGGVDADAPIRADVLSGLGSALIDLGDYVEAQARFEQAHDILQADRAAASSHLACDVWINLGEASYRLGELERSLERYQRSVDCRSQLLGPEHLRVSNALVNVGMVQGSLGDWSGARDTLEAALAAQERELGPGNPELASTRNNLAALLRRLGELERAGQLYASALADLEAAYGPEHPYVATALNNLAGVYRDQGAFADARPLYDRAVAVLESAVGPEHPYVAKVLSNVGHLQSLMGDYAGAERTHRRVLAIREAALPPQHPDLATTLNHLASVLGEQGRYEESRGLLERALAMREATLGPDHPQTLMTVNNLASALRGEDTLQQSAALYERAIASWTDSLGASHPLTVHARHSLGMLYYLEGRDPQAGLALVEASTAATEEVWGPWHPRLKESLRDLAEVQESAGLIEEARSSITRALAIEERIVGTVLPVTADAERRRLLSQSREVLDQYLSLHDRPDDATEAYRHVLAFKGASRRAWLHQRRVAGGDPALRERLDAVRGRLADLVHVEYDPGLESVRREQLTTLAAQKELLERQLTQSSPAFARLQTLTGSDPHKVCEALAPGTALVDYFAYLHTDLDVPHTRGDHPPRYRAWVMVGGACEAPLAVDLGPASALDGLVQTWRDQLADGALDAATRTGDALRAALLDPLLPAIGPHRRLLVVPDGQLATVSMAGLPLDAQGARYVVDDWTIGYLESANDLLDPLPPPALGGALVVGGVAYDGSRGGELRGRALNRCVRETLEALPGSRREARRVARVLRRRGLAITALTGEDATESALAEAIVGKRTVHLATHGFLDSTECGDAGIDPMLRSGLALAGINAPAPETGDGFWTAEEVSSLELGGTELVVLSACHTGAGAIVSGEGVLGLRRAFSVAGVRNLVMALWAVPDAETASLMQAFYAGDTDPVTSLREAQLSLLDDERAQGRVDPRSWAGFIATGR